MAKEPLQQDMMSAANAARAFTATARELPEIQAILLEEATEDHARIWIVTSATPFQAASRRPIYELQRNFLRRSDVPPLDFRLVNPREVSEPTTSWQDLRLAGYLPQTAEPVFLRQPSP
jgi:hypothetical protein